MAKVLTLEELENTHGYGYEEMMFAGDEEEPAGVELMACVWINGHIMLADGNSADTGSDVFRERYGRRNGNRIWYGKPSAEQREAEPWN